MRCALTATIAALIAGVYCEAGTIDFTPVDGKRVLEGITFPQVLFRQNGRQISYEPPNGWSCNGDGKRLRLSPPNNSQAQAVIEQTLLPANQILDESTIKQLAEMVMASLPAEARNIQVVGEEHSPVRINQQESHEVFVIYSYFGQDYEASALFANLDDLQLRFRLVTRKADFEALHRAFRGSLFSLRWF